MRQDPILVVDDNPMNLKLVRFLLDSEGFEVRTAGDSTEALTVLKNFHPRLILMDVQMPGMDGLQLTRMLKADPSKRDIVILALTAYAMVGDEEAARSAGCAGYITKPIDTRTLAVTVKQYLGNRQSVKPALQAGDHRDLLAEMRNNFLMEGMEEGERLVSGFSQEFDAERAKRISHRWAGIAGTLGFEEIGVKARSVEKFLDRTSKTLSIEEHQSRVRSDLLELLQMFSEAARGKKKLTAYPSTIVQVLSGKTIALVGFRPAEAARMSGALAQAQAYALAYPDLASLNTLESIHAIVIHASAVGLVALAASDTPVVVVGSAAEMLRHMEPDFSDQTCDFVVAPWDGEEIVLRVHGLLAGQTASQSLAKALPPEKPRAVIADDDPMVTTLVSTALNKLGIECFIAHDGREALTLASEKLPNVLVLDVKMPQVSGFDVLLSLKRDKRTSRIHVVMLTGRDQESEMMRGFGCGADDYVTKPFKPTELAARVLRLLPKPAATPYVFEPESMAQ